MSQYLYIVQASLEPAKCKIGITDNLERDKSFVESMSCQARIQDETIKQRRNERYQQMIDEAGEVVSPASRLHH